MLADRDRQREQVNSRGGSSSDALHENCGHVPEVKTQPQNTDRITRRIILDYIPLSKSVC